MSRPAHRPHPVDSQPSDSSEDRMAFTHPVSRPFLTGRELEYVTDAVSGGWISSQGPYVRRFEEAFAAWNGVAHGVACSSGTAALTLALRALGIGPGDEVIVPEFTMIASAWAVTYTGATPVFVDCADDLNIDVTRVEEKITPRTRAIMPVHVYGRRCDMDAIMDIAHQYNLRVVEDSAEAHGVRPVGTSPVSRSSPTRSSRRARAASASPTTPGSPGSSRTCGPWPSPATTASCTRSWPTTTA